MARTLNLRTAVLGAALAAFSGTACDSPPSDALEECSASRVLPTAVQTDILFVVDDSGSMAGEQTNLATNLAGFVDALDQSAVEIDYRIGVTTTGVEEFGGDTTYRTTRPNGTSTPEGGNPFPAGALVADDPASPDPGDLLYDASAYGSTGGWGGLRVLARGAPAADVDAFKENFVVGTDGPSKEQPFRAARLALSDRIADGVNAGFLRSASRLAVVFVSDEDDCSDSAEPLATTAAACDVSANLDAPAELAEFLLGPIAGEFRDVAVGAIIWRPGDPTCTTAADAGARYLELRDAIGASRFTLGSVCDTDFKSTLAAFAEALKPSSLPLEGAPADHRMLVVGVTKAAGESIACVVALEGSADEPTADAVYSAPRAGRPATITFQNACELDLGDRIDVQVVCAG